MRPAIEDDLGGGDRATDPVALGDIAAQLAEQIQRAAILDSLGDDIEPERVAELDRRSDELGVARSRAPGERRAEAAVELHLRDREVVEIGERGEPGAEVVDRHRDPERAEPRRRRLSPARTRR